MEMRTKNYSLNILHTCSTCSSQAQAHMLRKPSTTTHSCSDHLSQKEPAVEQQNMPICASALHCSGLLPGISTQSVYFPACSPLAATRDFRQLSAVTQHIACLSVLSSAQSLFAYLLAGYLPHGQTENDDNDGDTGKVRLPARSARLIHSRSNVHTSALFPCGARLATDNQS